MYRTSKKSCNNYLGKWKVSRDMVTKTITITKLFLNQFQCSINAASVSESGAAKESTNLSFNGKKSMGKEQRKDKKWSRTMMQTPFQLNHNLLGMWIFWGMFHRK